MSKVRISSLHVELCIVLGDIIRQKLRYPVLKTECWTFESHEVLHKPTVWFKYPNGKVEDLHFIRKPGVNQLEPMPCYNTLPPEKIRFRWHSRPTNTLLRQGVCFLYQGLEPNLCC